MTTTPETHEPAPAPPSASLPPPPPAPLPPPVRSPGLLPAYQELSEVPGFWRTALLGLASKLPAGMLSLSLLLLVARHHSYGIAGLTVSSLAIGQGLTGPLRGRLVDRCSRRAVLLCCLGGHLTALALLLLAVEADGSVPAVTVVPAVLVLAALAGASAPPVAVMMRTVWHPLTGPRTLATAMALDAAMMGTALIVGPVLASWLSLSVSATAPFVVVAVLATCVVGCLSRRPRHPLVPEPDAGSGTGTGSGTGAGGVRRRGPLSSGPFRRLFAVNGLFVCAVTAVDVVLPMYAKEHGATAYTGVFLGALSVGSVLGSLLLGAVPGVLLRRRQISVLIWTFALGTAALASAALISPLAVLLLAPAAGLTIGSAFGALRTLGGDLAPPGRVTETMSWLATLDTAGGAAGAAVFAQLVASEGSRVALGLVPMVAVLAGVVGWNTRVGKGAGTVPGAGGGLRNG